MPMPTILSQTGTGTVYWTPDFMQNPFVVGFGLKVGTATATVNVDASFDNLSIGTTNMSWFTISTTSLTAVLAATAIVTAPVQSFRLNIVSAFATSVATVTFVQSTFSR